MHANAIARREGLRPLPLNFKKMWREGYDYPSDDDEQDERDLLDRADEAHEQQNDK